MDGEGKEEWEDQEEVWVGASAAASPGVLASLAPRQRGVGGGMLWSNFNPVSLEETENTKNTED